ncbi:uncharacterized protein LOC120126123 [Hibiscus syriacus]|uniref:uncharacterized protein LOC120126123 n=1 Tax=Hibiscus syriacus TaxID=106335 RepID=UPI001923EAEA|nr:uncharacterized protein LOC120126123 [Hibiscus syriacus]
MNVLSNILNNAASRGIFSFHPKCKKIELTHLSFADDLLIFCKGNLEFVMGVITVLDCFYEYSGLKLNAGKCEIFTAGISAHNLESIINYTGFKQGKLPVRYLGVPLVTRELTDKDCKALLDNIKSRLHQWSRKNLSYTDRVELIKIVLYSVANYWCRNLKGSDIYAVGARVSWVKICKPKSEGGLGLKDIKSWNNACLMFLIRKLLVREGSLWIAWLQSYIIKQHDFWTMEIPQSASWSFKRMLKLRNAAQTVRVIAVKSTKEIWEEIRPRDAKVAWHKLLWYPLHVSKHSIISWMIILDRLPLRTECNDLVLLQTIFACSARKQRKLGTTSLPNARRLLLFGNQFCNFLV